MTTLASVTAYRTVGLFVIDVFVKTSVSKGGLGMCQLNDFYLILEF